jgi:hypothetical protein
MAATSRGFFRPTTTPTPDEIFDVWLSELTGSELKVLLYIARRTFGFKKDADRISLTQICEGIVTREGKVLDRGTGLSRTSASRAVKTLESLGLIVVRRSQDEGGEYEANTYRLRFRGFDDGRDTDSESNDDSGGEGSPKSGPGVVQKSDYRSTKSGLPVVQKLDPQQTESQETASQQTVRQQTVRQQTAPPPASGDDTEAGGQEIGAGAADLSDEVDTSSSSQVETQPEPDAASSPENSPVVQDKPADEAIRVLVDFGVFRSRARALVASLNLSPEKASRACEALEEEIKAGSDIRNRAAVLASRLEEGWEPPEPEKPDYLTGFYDDSSDELKREPPPEPDRPPLPEVVDAQGRGHDAYEWFDGVKRELELQLPRDTYNTWLRQAELEGYQPPGEDTPPVVTIRLQNRYGHAWFKGRLDKVIKRHLDRLLGADVERRYTFPDTGKDDDTEQAA